MKTKTWILAIVMGMASLSAHCQTVDDLFREFKDKDGTQLVNVNKEMMAFAAGFIEKDGNNHSQEIKDLLKKVDFIRILNIEGNHSICKSFAEKAAKLKKNGYEPLVTTNEEDGERTLILTKFSGEAITELVILSIEDDECALIQIGGKMRPEDVEKLSKIAS